MGARRVGIRELRQNLSQTIRLAERGESIDVTRDGEPVARIVPVKGRTKLDHLIAEGRATPATGSLEEFLRTYEPLKSTTGMTTDEAIQEDRGD